ncbi:MAG: Response regulator containing a CheY-like receiver domain and an DNA-binding domain [Ilumatobacteraceae bacterium]|nr:Response regulator containing a CheY-like receiver domain and an DNA-binding domain [Ilumatobacteraceae bacterium]
MTEMGQLENPDDPYRRWVAMWQEAVRASHSVIGLAELSSARFLALSRRGAEMLGTSVEGGVGLSYVAVVEPPRVADEAFRLAREGILDGCQTRRTLRRPDGSVVDVQATGWAIRSSVGPDLGLWMASEVLSTGDAATAEEVVDPPFLRQHQFTQEGDRVTLDDHWRVTSLRSRSGSLLGRTAEELLATSFIDLTHPDDLAALLFAFARATTDRTARALVRLRHKDQTWRVIQAAPAVVVDGAGTTHVTLFVHAEEDLDASESRCGVNGIPGHLRRIADQIETAGMLAPLEAAADVLRVATTTDLTPRQWEIVARLIRGQRVPTIAAETYLSRSTVRNHLSAIFAKVGVHSQEQLLALFRNEARKGLPEPS